MACSDPTCQALREQLCHLVSEQAMMLLFSVLLICSRVTVPQKLLHRSCVPAPSEGQLSSQAERGSPEELLVP